MSVQPFEPQYMKIGILTAALQELTPREIRDADPDRAIEDWLAFAREVGADNIQLSAALHPRFKGRCKKSAHLSPGITMSLAHKLVADHGRCSVFS